MRLGWYLYLLTGAIYDDPRYRKLIDDWGRDAARKLFWELQIQAAVALVLILTIIISAHNPATGLRSYDLLPVIILAVGIAGEALANF